jgi:hypothetical protein
MIKGPQGRARWVPRETGDDRARHAKAMSSPSSGLRSIMLSAKVSAGRSAWKLPSAVKAEGGSDSRARRSMKCSCCESVADAG